MLDFQITLGDLLQTPASAVLTLALVVLTPVSVVLTPASVVLTPASVVLIADSVVLNQNSIEEDLLLVNNMVSTDPFIQMLGPDLKTTDLVQIIVKQDPRIRIH